MSVSQCCISSPCCFKTIFLVSMQISFSALSRTVLKPRILLRPLPEGGLDHATHCSTSMLCGLAIIPWTKTFLLLQIAINMAENIVRATDDLVIVILFGDYFRKRCSEWSRLDGRSVNRDRRYCETFVRNLLLFVFPIHRYYFKYTRNRTKRNG